jgi:hypothetical protein
MDDTVEGLVRYCRENNRVCPLPRFWNDLWEMLPDRKRDGGGWRPPLPLILAAWHDTPALPKMLRLIEHIEWGAKKTGSTSASELLAAFTRYIGIDYWGTRTGAGSRMG